MDETGEPAGPRRLTAFDRVLRRYEPVIATVAAVSLLAVYGPGGGGIPTAASVIPPAVTPFTPAAEAPSEPVEEPTRVSLPPRDAGGPVATYDPTAPVSPSVPAPPNDPDAPLFADTGDLGDLVVFSTIKGGEPTGGVATTAGGWVYVAVGRTGSKPARILAYRPDGSLARSIPVEELGGRALGLVLAADGKSAYVSDTAPAQVLKVHLATGKVTVYAAIPDVDRCVPPVTTTGCDGSLIGAAPHPSALAFDDAGTLFVADAGQGAIWTVAAKGRAVEQWYVDLMWATPDEASGPAGLAFDGAGNLVVTVGATFPAGNGGVFVVERADTGAAGARTQIRETADGALPGAVAVAQSGKVFVALRGGGGVEVLDPNGALLTTIPDGGGLGRPLGLAFRGRSLMVPTAAVDGGNMVARLPVEEPGGAVNPGP